MDYQVPEGYSIRRLGTADLPDFKQARLEALRLEPSVFGSNYAREAAFSDEEWAQRLGNPQSAFFGLYAEGLLTGITGIITTDEAAGEALLVASYIQKAHRGKGLANLLYQARIGWAREHHYRCILVSHRADNERSKRANQRFGFVYTHTEPVQWPDGTTEDNVHYQLDIQERSPAGS